MATLRQKKLAKAIVKNLSAPDPLNKQELVVSSGYSPTTADGHANEIIEQKGVQEELKVLGFDTDTAKGVVSKIMTDGENDSVKLKAADMVFKVQGDYAPERHVNLNIDADLTERESELGQTLRELLA